MKTKCFRVLKEQDLYGPCILSMSSQNSLDKQSLLHIHIHLYIQVVSLISVWGGASAQALSGLIALQE